MMTPDQNLISILTLSLCVIVTIRAIHFRKTASANKRDLEEALISIDSKNTELKKLQKLADSMANFKNNLQDAEISTKMQKSRLSYTQKNDKSVKIPERYRYIHNLSEKGLSSSDIASILTISPSEAEQLLALANLSQK